MSGRMKRWIDQEHMERFGAHFAFLFKRVRMESGELDLRLRDNYFNLYYKGNSLAKVYVDRQPYEVAVHEDFTDGLQRVAKWPLRNGYRVGTVDAAELHPFFSKANIDRMARNIKTRNYQEEIRVEQMMITDSLGQDDLFFIDRQITGGALGRSRLDLLALKQVSPGQNRYQFVIVEVKLGNNPELWSDVGGQIQGYVKTWSTESAFADFRHCYEQVYSQMLRLKLLQKPDFPSIVIEPPVTGCIVVAGYSGKAKEKISVLQKKCPDLKVMLKSYCLTQADLR